MSGKLGQPVTSCVSTGASLQRHESLDYTSNNRSANLLYVSTLDDASGITIDYIHGEASVPYSFTPELRSMGDHDNSTIEPSFQENWAALVATINEIEEIASETR